MKLVVKLFGGLVLVLILVVAGLFFYLDRIITEAIVRIGPEVTETRVSLDSARLSLLNGAGSLKGLAVGNPEGFSEEDALSLDSISIELDSSTLQDEVMIVHLVEILGPTIRYESGKNGDNLQALQKNIERNLGSEDEAAKDTDESEQKVIIERFVLKGAQINAQHSLLPGQTFAVNLPDLELTEIGRKSNGATIKEAAGQIITAITRSAKSAVTGSDVLKGATEALRSTVKDGIDGLKDENLGKAKDKVKGLLKGFGN